MMHMSFLESLQKALDENCYLKQGDKVLLGLSGGADSLSLLHGLARLNWQVTAAHFDHGLRPESALEAQKVVAMAAACGVPCLAGRGDVAAFAQENRLSVEEAARTMRYRFLFAQARAVGAQGVVVAHTANDQVETVLMHWLRGAGLAGLKGMTSRIILPEWDAALPLIRPLLGTWRVDIEAYCHENGLQPLNDPSNQNQDFFRNRLRHELIPYLQSYNPNIQQGLWRTAEALAGDFEILQTLVEPAWAACLEGAGDGYVSLNLNALRAILPEGMQRNLLKRSIALLRPGLRDLSFETLQRGLAYIHQSGHAGQVDLMDGLCLYVEQGHLYVMEQGALLPYPWPRVTAGWVGTLMAPGEVVLLDGWRISADWSVAETPPEDEWGAYLDWDALELPLQVRAGRAGERWQPLGMAEGKIKLADFWINVGLPRRARKAWPLVCSGEQVAWIPGFRPANFCRMNEKTKRVVILRLIPPVQ